MSADHESLCPIALCPIEVWHKSSAVTDATRHVIGSIAQLREEVFTMTGTERPSLQDVIKPLGQLDNIYQVHRSALSFHADFSEDKDITAAVEDAKRTLSEARAELVESERLLEVLRGGLQGQIEMDPETEKFAKCWIKMCESKTASSKRGGGAQQRLEEIEERIKVLKAQCQQNARTNDESMTVSVEDLAGVPADIIQTLKDGVQPGQKLLGFNEHDHVVEKIRGRGIRVQWEIAKRNKCMQNLPLLEELVHFRSEAASLRGFPDHASRVLREQEAMAGTPDTALKSLYDAKSMLTSAASADKDGMIQRKRAALCSAGIADDKAFHYWDYYLDEGPSTIEGSEQTRQEFYEYFQAEATLSRLLEIFGGLFGLDFEQIPHSNALQAICNRPMLLYAATDSSTKEFLGHLFVDFYGGAFCNDCVQPGYIRPDGTRQRPTVVLSCDFSKPDVQSERPGLLSHFQLIMLCHEMGHSFHDLVSKTRFARFHGTSTTVDFAEGLSQMFEKFAHDERFLKRVGRHYSHASPVLAELWRSKNGHGTQQPPAEIPDELRDRFLAIKSSFGSPLFWLEQIQMGLFDLRIHSLQYGGPDTSIDLTREYNNLLHDVGLFDVPAKEQDMDRSFLTWNHILENYDARYYSYMYSDAIAADVYETCFRADPFDSHQGSRVRTGLMEKGGSEDPKVLWHHFMGRELRPEAFANNLLRRYSRNEQGDAVGQAAELTKES